MQMPRIEFEIHLEFKPMLDARSHCDSPLCTRKKKLDAVKLRRCATRRRILRRPAGYRARALRARQLELAKR